MEDLTRKFFWKGGKENAKKIPLISWAKISMPKLEGGLNFKNLSLQNIALGAKLIWRIIGPNPGWAQRALWKKYFRGKRKRCLEQPIAKPNSVIQKLCAKSSSLTSQYAHWIPGNGKQIRIWEDRIMGCDPLDDDRSLHLLKDWMHHFVGYFYLGQRRLAQLDQLRGASEPV